jgi:hypothetical protein
MILTNVDERVWSVACICEKIKKYNILVAKCKENDHVEKLCVNGRILLKLKLYNSEI